jgi:hypothetical protein
VQADAAASGMSWTPSPETFARTGSRTHGHTVDIDTPGTGLEDNTLDHLLDLSLSPLALDGRHCLPRPTDRLNQFGLLRALLASFLGIAPL